MLITLIVLTLVIAITLFFIGRKASDETDTYFYVPAVMSIMVSIGLIVALIVGITLISTESKIDYQIETYQEQNVVIEENVRSAVEKYLEHEEKVFDSLQGEDITTLLVSYPEIASNELIVKQIEVYINNAENIRSLKDRLASLITWRFLVYFGN